ncbi:MAG: signal peptidase [Nocardioides sp.]|jgi:signal peptidase I|nr:signal peptidase [Nocardioides sp.]
MSRDDSRVRALREVLLTVGAALGTTCIAVALASTFFGVTPLVFRSGSMAPAVQTGDLGIAHHVPAGELRAGDIVSVDNSRGVRVTHRVVSSKLIGNSATLVLKGDANETADIEPYVVTSADRLMFSIPKAGYVVTFMSGPIGIFFGGLLVGAVILLLLNSRSRRNGDAADDSTGDPTTGARGGRRKAPGRRRAERTTTVVGMAAVLTLPLAGLAAGPVGTLAAWNDPVPVTSAADAYTVPAPNGDTCTLITPGTNSVRGVKLTWPATVAPLPPLSYTTPTFTNITPVTNAVATSGTEQVLTQTYNPGTVANQNKIVTVTDRAFPTGVAAWLSPITSWKYRTGGTSATQPVCGEVDPPTVAFVGPDSTSRTVAAEKTFITSACTTNTVIACGTYLDANTVTVDYTLRRVVSGVTRCWAGSWTNSAVGGACTAFQAAATAPSGGQTTWYETASQSTVYAASGGAGVYTLTVRATDSWANVTTQVLTFTLT